MAGGERNIVVTGASRGIGAAIAVELARRGHKVGCLTRKGAGVEQGELPAALARRLVPLKGDVLDPGSIKAALAAFEAAAGPLSGLVNNAGLHREAPAADQPLAEFEAVMATNAVALFSACQQAYPFLVRAGGGLIVNLGSFFDRLGVRRNAAYCASKAAVGAITRCLAVEWARDRVRVLDVAPGYVETDLNKEALASEKLRTFLRERIPTGTPVSAAEVARVTAGLFGEDAPSLTGATLYLDGGQGMAL